MLGGLTALLAAATACAAEAAAQGPTGGGTSLALGLGAGLLLGLAAARLLWRRQQPAEPAKPTAPSDSASPAGDQARLLQRVFDDTAQGFWFLDLDGVTTDLNPAMCALLGRDRRDVIGRRATDFFGGDDRTRMQAQIASRKDGRHGAYPATIVRPDGSRVECLNTASPISGAGGAPIGSVGIWTNLNTHHEAEAALHIHQVVVNTSSDMISVIDDHEAYQLVNDAWCAGTGIPREQALSLTTIGALPTLATERRRLAIEAAIRHRRTDTVHEWVQLGGRPPRYLESIYYPFADSGANKPLVMIVTRDITQQEQDRLALATAAEVLRCTLEATGDALFATDAHPVNQNPDERVQFANNQFFQLYQLPDAWRPAPTLRQIDEGIDPWLIDPVAEHARVQEIIEGRAPAQDRVRLRDGRVLLRRYSCVPMGERLLRVWSMRDISVEVAAVEAEEAAAAEQRTLLDQYPGFIAVIDKDNRYLYANGRLAWLLRTRAEQLVGRTIEEIHDAPRAAAISQHLALARRTGHVVSESRYLADADHPEVSIEVNHLAGPRHADGGQRVYVFGTDVTERARAQQVLKHALTEAERANKAKSQFLSRMSHELRTPLNAVLGFGQLLQAKIQAPEHLRFVDEILHGGRHLLALINDLLDLGRVEAGELDVLVEPVTAAAAIADSVGLVRPLALEQGVSLEQATSADVGLAVQADPRRLRQVLLNLLSNGIKYNRPGGRVEVTAEAIGHEVEFRVRDTGPGLSAGQQLRLFQPFERLDANRSGIDGTGIGLALCRSLVEAMAGRIGVHSTPGEGSVFWVRLPRAATPRELRSPDRTDTRPAPASVHRKTALYIEDNVVNQMLMRAMLENELDLDTTADPFEGLQMARTMSPDVILLDIQLPGIDGYEVLRRLRADARTRAIPVLAVSANAMPADLEAGEQAGFQAYLTKPVDIDELLTAVRRVTGGATDA